ncbi:HupE/UreJ family protein [Falsihalocynthiibacter sp. S25ZX9]|uniref:HupE/UreJ family protein n=1 Tax=Falsihalocynthiibacter sp. S25ZX9 TaxID=3240870 RepID=UPI00350E9C15
MLNLNVRILHVDHVEDGLRVYLRTPMPYLVADKVGPAVQEGLPIPAPFTSNTSEGGKLTHYVDFEQLALDPLGLGALAEQGFHFETGGKRVSGMVEHLRVYRVGTQPVFATLSEALNSFAVDYALPDSGTSLYVGDAMVDVVIRYKSEGPIASYALSSTMNPKLPGQENTANLILDYGPGQPRVFRSRGLMQDPIQIDRSPISAVKTFIIEGIRHILEGIDHVLFVICLVLGATGFRVLLGRVTGFTIGHSVTLALGFFGFVPSGAWFVPMVETGIALSIIYAAVLAIRPSDDSGASERRTFLVTCAIGLLHGLGFSFVLQNILQIDSAGIWQSLLAFNIGVEIGQLSIVLLCWPVFVLIRRLNRGAWRITKFTIGATCIVIASVWTLQRVTQIAEAFA